MRRLIVTLVAAVGTTAGLLALWRRNPRFGAGFMNRVVDPFLVSRGIAGTGRSEVGTLEHVGRTSGTRRLTPVHPEITGDGFRIIVPLGLKSEWARNVLAAGHCRMQLHGIVYELDEPALLLPREMADLPAPARTLFGLLGFEYLRLRRFAEAPGTLEESVPAAAGEAPAQGEQHAPAPEPAPEAAPA